MAWYYGTFSCGHEGRVNIIGPGKDREWKRERAFEGVCSDCYRKQKEEEREAEKKEAAEKSQEMDFPELSGSEKQIAWANQIRYKLVSARYENCDLHTERIKKKGKDQDYIDRFRSRKLDPVDYFVKHHIDAKYWIEEMRCMTAQQMYEIARDEYKKAQEEIENLGMTLEEAKQEKSVTVEPEEKLKDGVAKLILEGKTVKALYHKDSDFIKSVKEKGFKWSGSAWELEITEYTGSASDRIADLGNELLHDGFSVQFPDKEIKNKAISGEFEPLNDKWVKWSAKREKLALDWNGRNDDLYWKAKKLPDARWHSWMVIPVEYYKEVIDFADINGFNISKTATKRIEEYKTKEAGFETVDPETVEKEEHDKLKDILEKSGTIEDLKDED